MLLQQVIGAGAFVRGDVPAVVTGNPAMIVKRTTYPVVLMLLTHGNTSADYKDCPKFLNQF